MAGRDSPEATDYVTDRVIGSALGAIDLLAIALGDRLGYYRLLAGRELSAPALAPPAPSSDTPESGWSTRR